MARFRPLLAQVSLLVVIGALALAIGAASGEPPLDLTLRARDMAFYLDGDDMPNPALVLPPDRRIRLTFVNQDRGIEHDLTLPELDRRTRVLPGNGSRQTLTFRTPEDPARSTYNCSLHLAMMRGAIEIR